MKIEIILFEAQLNAIFTIVKNFSWANAYAEKCNPQLNAFFTTWRWGWNEKLYKTPGYRYDGIVLRRTDGGLDSLAALAAFHPPRKTGSWFYQEPVFSQLSASSKSLAISCSSFSEQYQDHSGTELQLQRLKQYLKRRQYKEDLAS